MIRLLPVPFFLLFVLALAAHDWHQHGHRAATKSSSQAKSENTSNAEELESAFEPFSPDVRTRSDDTYFYIEGNGIASHEMMTGITAWQQQVPVPQYYYGDNAWQIPLNPQPAQSTTPVSTDNLLKGAVAIAVNGIPIFNLYNNRGENTYQIGELDNWGGHCGRADDYHYHIVPYHLSSVVGDTHPLAYALDGYPIYGDKEPDGADISVTIDVNQGHTHGVFDYHYHALANADYAIKGLYGVVNVSGNGPENQITPQARTSEFRPALTPLNGAVITSYSQPSETSFSITYTKDGQTYTVNWSVDSTAGSITYEFVSPNGSTTTDTYNNWQAAPELLTPVLFEGPLADPIQLEGNWYFREWLGSFYYNTSDATNQWIYQAELGWLYLSGDDDSAVWVYSPEDNLGWVWTNSTIFTVSGSSPAGFLYRDSDSRWIYFMNLDGTNFYYHYKTGSESEDPGWVDVGSN